MCYVVAFLFILFYFELFIKEEIPSATLSEAQEANKKSFKNQVKAVCLS